MSSKITVAIATTAALLASLLPASTFAHPPFIDLTKKISTTGDCTQVSDPLHVNAGTKLTYCYGVNNQTYRTITVTDLDCRRMAMISSEAPRSSWAGLQSSTGEFSNYYGELYSTGAVLIQFPLDRIPAGQRITNAELIIPVALVYQIGRAHV